MALQPTDWSVVIAGRWNCAILTPNGIAKRLFRLKEDQKVLVAVPLDSVSPYIVKHPTQEIRAMTDEGRLLIQATRSDYETLGYAMTAGVNALTSLPETPVSAAGFNVNFRTEEVSPETASLLVSESEKALVDAEFKLTTRIFGRSIEYGAGTLNVTMKGSDDSFSLSLNFHRGSKILEELKQWLQVSVEHVEETVGKILGAFGLDIEEIRNDADGE